MKLPRRQFLHLAAGAAALPVRCCTYCSERKLYPMRPITICRAVPRRWVDGCLLSRIVAQRMRVSLGQPVIIVYNRVAAAPTVASELAGFAAQAHPDGYTARIGQWGYARRERSSLRAAIRPNDKNHFKPVALLS